MYKKIKDEEQKGHCLRTSTSRKHNFFVFKKVENERMRMKLKKLKRKNKKV